MPATTTITIRVDADEAAEIKLAALLRVTSTEDFCRAAILVAVEAAIDEASDEESALAVRPALVEDELLPLLGREDEPPRPA